MAARLLQDGRGHLLLSGDDRADRDRWAPQLFRCQPEGHELQTAAAQRQWPFEQLAGSGVTFFETSLEIVRDWSDMVVLGIVLLLIGLFVQTTISSLLTTIGVILIVVGAGMWILGSVAPPIGGRRYWY